MSCQNCPYNDVANDSCSLSEEEWYEIANHPNPDIADTLDQCGREVTE